MTDTIRRHPIITAVSALLLLLFLMASFPVVSETKQAVVVRFGKPNRILGGTQAGINWRIPFAENIVWIDKRVRSIDMERQQVLSTDQRRLEVDAFARYRIVDPLRMYVSARSEDRVSEALRPILGSSLRNELGKRRFAELLSPERQGAMENVRTGLNRIARQYGVEIIDVRIKKADLPDGTPLQSAFERMKSDREQEARSIRAEGQKRARIIQAEADAEAARIYSQSFGRDAEFYNFYRAMQAYRATFVGDEANPASPTTVILSPNDDFLKEFSGR